MTEFTVETPAFRQALATALAFASTDDTLPPINQVYLKAVEQGIEIAATDRYILSVEQINATGKPFDAGIPQEVAKRLLTLLPRPRRSELISGMTSIAQDGDKVTVRIVGDYETAITFTPADETKPGVRFINYREMLDKVTAGREAPVAEMGFTPSVLERATKAMAARSRRDVFRVTLGSALQPVLLTQGTLTVLVMPARLTREYEGSKAVEVAA